MPSRPAPARSALLDLARRLRRRVEQSPRSSWKAGAAAAPRARVAFLGEGPAFSPGGPGTPAGALLDRILAAIGLSRRTAAVVELVPGGPPPDELLRALAPRIVVAMGAAAAAALPRDGDPAALLATRHPDELLRAPELKKEVWKDMKELKARLSRDGG